MTTPRLQTRLNANTETAIGAFRIVIGLLFTIHGSAKVLGWPIGQAYPVGEWPVWWAYTIELVAGLLVTIGLFTRPAAFVASGHMAVAYFWQHWLFASPEIPKSFWPHVNEGELAVLYCFAFLLLVFTGPGRFAVGTVISQRR